MNKHKNIKENRLAMNMTLEELANKVGTSKQTIQRYESGVISNIPTDMIEKIAEALNTTPAIIMGWETPESKQKGAALLREAPINRDVIVQALNRLSDEELQDLVSLVEYLASKRDKK